MIRFKKIGCASAINSMFDRNIVILIFELQLMVSKSVKTKTMATENLDKCFEVAVRLIEDAGKVSQIATS